MHDFFNLLAVFIFPAPGADVRSAAKECGRVASLLLGSADMSMKGMDFMKPLISPSLDLIDGAVAFLPGKGRHRHHSHRDSAHPVLRHRPWQGAAKGHGGPCQELLHKALGRGPLTGIASGTLVTVMVQSSSTTTSLMIPWREAACSTPASSIPSPLGPTSAPPSPPCWRHRHQRCRCPARPDHRPGPRAVQPLRRGAHHGVPFLRELPIKAAEALARVGSENKLLALGYVAGLFFALPALMMVAVRSNPAAGHSAPPLARQVTSGRLLAPLPWLG